MGHRHVEAVEAMADGVKQGEGPVSQEGKQLRRK